MSSRKFSVTLTGYDLPTNVSFCTVTVNGKVAHSTEYAGTEVEVKFQPFELEVPTTKTELEFRVFADRDEELAAISTSLPKDNDNHQTFFISKVVEPSGQLHIELSPMSEQHDGRTAGSYSFVTVTGVSVTLNDQHKDVDPYFVCSADTFQWESSVKYKKEEEEKAPKPFWDSCNFVMELPQNDTNQATVNFCFFNNHVEKGDAAETLGQITFPASKFIRQPGESQFLLGDLTLNGKPVGTARVSYQGGQRDGIGMETLEYFRYRKWNNWAGNMVCTPEITFVPKTEEQVCRILALAQQNKKQVRCTAQGHSWSPMAVTEEYLVDVRFMQEIRNFDAEKMTVSVEPGCSVKQLDDFLKTKGCCLPANVVLTVVRYGGVIGTGCHGSGKHVQTMSDLVTGMRIVDYKGEVISYSEETTPELMGAVKVNLGLFGVMTEITLKVEPMFRYHLKDRKVALSDIMDTEYLKKAVAEHDAVEVFWWPFNDTAWLKAWSKTTEPSNESAIADWFSGIHDYLGSRVGRWTFNKVTTYAPSLTPTLTRALWKSIPNSGDLIADAPRVIHFQTHIEDLPLFDTEFTILCDPEMKNVTKAVKILVDKVDEYYQQGKYPMNMAMEFRICRASDALISPASGKSGELYCFIEFLSFVNTADWAEFAEDVSNAWMAEEEFKARPHWAKMYQYVDSSYMSDYLRKAYGENLVKFEAIRSKVDPENRFLTKHLQEILCPDRSQPSGL